MRPRSRVSSFATAWFALSIPSGATGSPRVGTSTSAGTSEEASSILAVDELRVDSLLDILPTSFSYESLLENALLPVQPLIEESGGFSIIDPQKVSIRGASWLWNQWYFDRFNITDAFFDGAASLHVPFRFLSAVSVRHHEDADHAGLEGLVLRSSLRGSSAGGEGNAGRGASQLFGASFTEPRFGGIFPPAVGLMSVFSGSHATTRRPEPPAERRRLGSRLLAYLVREDRVPSGRLKYAVEVNRGSRRFLAFDVPDGDLAGVFEEGFTLASGAAHFEPEGGGYRAIVLAEYRERDRLFAELHYGPQETANLSSGALFAGVAWPRGHLGATLKYFTITHHDLEFTRDIHDVDGEALHPYAPDGDHFTAHADATIESRFFYLSADERLLFFAPRARSWSNTLTFDGAPYGRIDWASASTGELVGQARLGTRERVAFGSASLAYDLYLASSHAVNAAFTNTLLFTDIGAKAELQFPISGAFVPFVAAAKIPIPISSELARLLDPAYLNGRHLLGDETSGFVLLDTTGGRRTRVSTRIGQTNVYSGVLGLKSTPWDGWTLAVEGLFRRFENTYWIELEGGPEANGYFAAGRFYYDEGERAYRLTNYPLERDPTYFGFSIQLVRRIQDRFLLDLSFSAFTAVGGTAFGNGATANDLGVVHPATANPNATRLAFANLDGDRAFTLKALVAHRFADGLWIAASIRHKDGQPFSFYEYTKDGRQVAVSYASTRGSPLDLSRPLTGPREDFRLNIDLEIHYVIPFDDLHLALSLLSSNVLDFGNEIAERSNDVGRATRAALELEIPRALILSGELRY